MTELRLDGSGELGSASWSTNRAGPRCLVEARFDAFGQGIFRLSPVLGAGTGHRQPLNLIS